MELFRTTISVSIMGHILKNVSLTCVFHRQALFHQWWTSLEILCIPILLHSWLCFNPKRTFHKHKTHTLDLLLQTFIHDFVSILKEFCTNTKDIQIRTKVSLCLFKIGTSQWWRHFNKKNKQGQEETNSKFNIIGNVIQKITLTEFGACKSFQTNWRKEIRAYCCFRLGSPHD